MKWENVITLKLGYFSCQVRERGVKEKKYSVIPNSEYDSKKSWTTKNGTLIQFAPMEPNGSEDVKGLPHGRLSI